jgi:hypothetical protein
MARLVIWNTEFRNQILSCQQDLYYKTFLKQNLILGCPLTITITKLSLTTLSITLHRTNDSQHNNTQHLVFWAKRRYCLSVFACWVSWFAIVMVSVFLLKVVLTLQDTWNASNICFFFVKNVYSDHYIGFKETKYDGL